MNHLSRRQFVHLSGVSPAASYSLPFAPVEPFGGRKMHIQDAIDLISNACAQFGFVVEAEKYISGV